MKIIDANTGHVVELGHTFRNVDGFVTVLKVKEGVFSARVLVDINGEQRWGPLVVRYTHPGFMFQKVAFLPS